jgi:hypothetical protein
VGYGRRHDGHLIVVLPLMEAGAFEVVLHGDEFRIYHRLGIAPFSGLCSSVS